MIGNRIKLAREVAGMSQDELGKAIGITQQAIQKIEDGRTQMPRKLAAIATALGVKQEWLLTGNDAYSNIIEGEVIRPELPPGFANVEPYQPKTLLRVPVISEVQAGEWCEAVDNYYPGDGESFEFCPVDAGPHTFALRISGNSMTSPIPGEDSFRQGDLVFIDPDREVRPGDYVVAKILNSQEATFKQYVEDAGRRWLLPLNPKYEKIEFVEGMHICGRLIYHGKRY
jgi:SOS-response transcriptional repressor LexA